MGYDPRAKQYTGVWVDNFGSVPTQMKGTYNEETKTMTIVSKVVDVASGQEFQQKQVTQWTDANTKTFQIFLLAGDQEVKLMEMTGKKQKEKQHGK